MLDVDINVYVLPLFLDQKVADREITNSFGMRHLMSLIYLALLEHFLDLGLGRKQPFKHLLLIDLNKII